MSTNCVIGTAKGPKKYSRPNAFLFRNNEIMMYIIERSEHFTLTAISLWNQIPNQSSKLQISFPIIHIPMN